MTTQSYYKDRLGFDPNDPREMSSLDPTLHGYEENLSKFKGNKHCLNCKLLKIFKKEIVSEAQEPGAIRLIKTKKGSPSQHINNEMFILCQLD